MERLPTRKPKLYFDVGSNPSNVTFDDGKIHRRILPWMHFSEARWDHGEPNIVTIQIGDWLVTISGFNLAPLLRAIEEQTLVRLCARPEQRSADGEHQADTFATKIEFSERATPRPAKSSLGQLEFGAR